MSKDVPMNVALALTAEMIGVRLREHDSELEKVAAQMAAQEIRLATLDAASKHASDYAVALSARLERLESARIAAPVAPESAETAPGVPVEPGNATAPIRRVLTDELMRQWPNTIHSRDAAEVTVDHMLQAAAREGERIGTPPAEVAAALRMYRKAQGCRTLDDGVSVEINASEHWYETAAGLLAWLKEGEAQ